MLDSFNRELPVHKTSAYFQFVSSVISSKKKNKCFISFFRNLITHAPKNRSRQVIDVGTSSKTVSALENRRSSMPIEENDYTDYMLNNRVQPVHPIG